MKHMGDGQLAVSETRNEAIRLAESLRSELRSVGTRHRRTDAPGEADLQGRDVAGIGVHNASRGGPASAYAFCGARVATASGGSDRRIQESGMVVVKMIASG
jgi:hypothetical protein